MKTPPNKDVPIEAPIIPIPAINVGSGNRPGLPWERGRTATQKPNAIRTPEPIKLPVTTRSFHIFSLIFLWDVVPLWKSFSGSKGLCLVLFLYNEIPPKLLNLGEIIFLLTKSTLSTVCIPLVSKRCHLNCFLACLVSVSLWCFLSSIGVP